MNKTRKRFSLLLTLLCAFVLVLSLGIVSACGNNESASTENDGVNTQVPAGGTWYYGEDIPASDLGQDGDFYLNTKTLASYVKEGKAWRAAVEGKEIGKWYYGTDPLDGSEEFGDLNSFYLDTASGVLYQKGESGWTQILTLKGDKGRDGVVWFSGTQNPNTYKDETLKDAQKGDFFLDYERGNDAFTVWQLREDGTWVNLGTLRGEDAKDPVAFFNGDGEPDTEENKVKLANAKEGDLYLGQFTGFGGKNAGSILYRMIKGVWVPLMESMEKEGDVNIYSLAQLEVFAASVAENDYAGKTVHLKADIDFNAPEAAGLIALAALEETDAAEDWAPIGTKGHPFKGTFDGEGHIIKNFTAKTTDDATAVGFFGYIDGATIEHLHFEGVHVEVASGSVGAAVVGQATGKVSFNDVTVEGSVEAQEGAADATVGALVGSLEGTDETSLTVSGSSFEGEGAGELVGDEGDVTVTVTDSSISNGEETKKEWDENGKIVHRISAAQQLIDLVNSGVDLSKDKVLFTEDLDFTDAVAAGLAYMTKDCLFEMDGDGHIIKGLQYAMFLYVKGGSYLHDFTIDLGTVSLSGEDFSKSKLSRGAIAENIVVAKSGSAIVGDTVTVENVTIKGDTTNMRAAFFDESGEDKSTGTLNFINCRSEVNMTCDCSDLNVLLEVTKMSPFLNLPDEWNVNFTDCVNAGYVKGNPLRNPVLAGFISYAQGNGSNTITFTRCRNEGDVADQAAAGDPDIGGFIGKVQRTTNVVFNDCVNTGVVSCVGTSTISIGGFIGHANGDVTFNGTNINGAYEGEGDAMTPVDGKGDIRVTTTNGTVRVGGFIGFPDDNHPIVINGTIINTGDVTVERNASSKNAVTVYAGGIIGQTNKVSVTFSDDCKYFNFGNIEVTVPTGLTAYLGGIVGYVSNGTYTLGATATGYNAGTLTAENADTIYTGSFVGCVYSANAGLTDDTLSKFEDKGETGSKVGHSAA